MNDIETLKKIYEDNQKIEWDHELKGSPPIAGSIAKKLLNNCNRALKIVSKYNTYRTEYNLKKTIEEMEDELAKEGRIRTITYNLGARTFIHISITWVTRWGLKDG